MVDIIKFQFLMYCINGQCTKLEFYCRFMKNQTCFYKKNNLK